MSISFSESWKTLQFPHKRSELLLTLAELTSLEYQKAAWVNRTIDAHLVVGIDEIYHFFFDDTDLGSDTESCIGGILFDEKEVEALRPITKTLESMLRDLGDVGSKEFIEHPRWEGVVQAAKKAQEIFAVHGTPKIS